MRILSWNVQSGGGQRYTNIIGSIKNHSPDVVCLHELRRTGKLWSHLLDDNEYLYTSYRLPPAQRDNFSAVFSRLPLESEPFPAKLEKVSYWKFQHVTVENVSLLTSHVPFSDVEESFTFWNVLKEFSDKPHQLKLVIGDLNKGKRYVDESVVRPKTSGFYKPEQSFEPLLENLVDLWRENNSRTEYTWYSPKNGFRIDHALASKNVALLTTHCWYDHTPRENKHSDHSILLVDLETPTRHSTPVRT